MPRYPIYIPSKNRADVCYTAKYFQSRGVDFQLVVEPSQVESYELHFPRDIILVLPEDNLRLLGSRLWIREHSIAAGHKRHWQFDDNIRDFKVLHRKKRVHVDPNFAIEQIEEFTDRYTNIGVSGFNYTMFAHGVLNPFFLNRRVYSASLINNEMPYVWRMYYNDDVDLCLQVLAGGMCTVLFNLYLVTKLPTMKVKGGNTADLYQGDGRLVMARSIEEVWPQYCRTIWRFGRPQHHVKWGEDVFKQRLIRDPALDWDAIEKRQYKVSMVVKDPSMVNDLGQSFIDRVNNPMKEG
ncbi:MAG TPA: hypothetical protein VK171_02135 [Fimbriimonas sp.]|nr:hypothetical protein [Fimbriimonas sp.]